MNTETPQAAPTKQANKRSVVLFGLLGVMIAAIVYDYQVARPKVEDAYERLVEKNIAVNANPKDKMTPESVAEFLGQPASSTFDDGSEVVEVYSWRGGLIFKSHNLYVAYRKTIAGSIITRISKYVYDTREEVYGTSNQGGDESAKQLEGMSEGDDLMEAPPIQPPATTNDADPEATGEVNDIEPEPSSEAKKPESEPSSEAKKPESEGSSEASDTESEASEEAK